MVELIKGDWGVRKAGKNVPDKKYVLRVEDPWYAQEPNILKNDRQAVVVCS